MSNFVINLIFLLGAKNMLNFVLCDDNLSFLNGLDEMLSKLFIKNNIDASVSFKTDCIDKLLQHVRTNSVDVLFLDINLDNKNIGLSVAEEIRKINKGLRLIFTTGHFEFMMEAYKLNTFDYLVKPISYENLEKTVLRLTDYLDNSTNRFIKVNGTTFINQNDIHYIRKDGMKLIYHTKHSEYEAYNSFSKITKELPSGFVRCHKSFIANVNNISHIEINTNTIFFNNSSKCYIGPRYKDEFMEVINVGNSSNNLASINIS